MPQRRRRRLKAKIPPDFERKRKRVGKGKQVPKNDTKISFKSGSVVIPAQLESQQLQGPTNHRKLSLNVLFAQVNHHNSSVRHDALIGLRDIFQSNSELLPTNLPRLIEQVFSTLVDNSGAVRQASHTLVKYVLTSVSTEVISPFFGILVAHLNCGLTHIKEKIQLDALKLLALYLQHYSNLLVHQAGHILPILIGLLSKQGTIPSHSSSSKKKKKSLIGIIEAAPHIGKTTLVSNPGSSFASKCSQLRIFSIISRLLKSLLIEDNLLQTSQSILEDRDGYLETLVGILLQSWVECCPTEVMSSKPLATQSLSLMECIVNTLSVVVKVMVKVTESSTSTLTGIYRMSHDISAHMMCHFPFKITAGSSHSSFLFDLNFTFCEIILCLHKVLCSEEEDKSALATLIYLGCLDLHDIENITSSAQNLSMCSQVIVDIVPLVSELSHRRCVDSGVLKKVFAFCRELYFACHPHSRNKQLLVRCLSRMFVEELTAHGCSSLVMTELLLPWSSSLLDLFSDLKNSNPEVSSIVMDSIATAAIQCGATRLEHKIIPLLNSSVGFLSNLSEYTQRRVVELIWQLPKLRESELSLLSKCVVSIPLYVGVKQYLIQIVHHKCMRDFVDHLPRYLSFMWTVLLGCTSNEWSSTVGFSESDEAPNISIDTRSTYTNYSELHKTVCECLKASPVSPYVMTCLEEVMLNLKNLNSLPVNSVCGVLVLGCSLWPLHEEAVSTELISWLAKVCVSALVAASGSDVADSDHQLLLTLTYQVLSVWDEVLESVLYRFKDMIGGTFTSSLWCAPLPSECGNSAHAGGSDLHVKCLMEVLSHPDLYPVLWKLRSKLNTCLSDILALLPSSSPVGIRKELELAVQRFIAN